MNSKKKQKTRKNKKVSFKSGFIHKKNFRETEEKNSGKKLKHSNFDGCFVDVITIFLFFLLNQNLDVKAGIFYSIFYREKRKKAFNVFYSRFFSLYKAYIQKLYSKHRKKMKKKKFVLMLEMHHRIPAIILWLNDEQTAS